MQNISLIKQKILQYIDFIGITKYQFYQKTGITRGVLDKEGGISEDNIAKFIAYYPEVSNDWLLTGKGEMLKYQNNISDVERPRRNLIPLYNDVATIGGISEMGATTDSVSHTTEYIDAGDWFPGATDAIRHYGTSMVEYPSGSILALKRVEDMRLIFWGRTYCIETTEGRLTKRLNKSKIKDVLLAYSSNNETYPDGVLIHGPIEIPTETIRRVFQVLGCVTKEYSSGIVEIINKNN
jgi:hypothetical protein